MGHLKELCNMLENEHTSIESTDDFGATAIHAAAIPGNVKVMEYLISGGADVDSKVHRSCDEDGTFPILYAVMKGHIDAAKILVN